MRNPIVLKITNVYPSDKNEFILTLAVLLLFLIISFSLAGQSKESLELIGKIKPRNANEIQSSLISVGAEMMDRDYTIYNNWKEYLGPLGVKKARIQSGWAKCEKEKGVYNLAWLDEIIYDMLSQGVEPWISLSYGNPIYPGGGGLHNEVLPSSEEALNAWGKYVSAVVERYKDNIDEWEIWNEPNYDLDAVEFARFSILTAKTVKAIQPEAIIIGMALGSHVDYKYADKVLAEMERLDGIRYIDQVIHHRHISPPEEYFAEAELERVVDKYSSRIIIRQGEAGCPSAYNTHGAMKNQDWSEIQQAKHILRRLILDIGRGKETSIFTIIGNKVGSKGLLAANKNKEVAHVKPAYYALQHATSIFDNSLKPISNYSYEATIDTNLVVVAHKNIYSEKQAVALWFGNRKVTLSTEKQKLNIKFYTGDFLNPVWVDLRTGNVYEIPENKWDKNGSIYSFSDIPVYDSPVLIIDKSLITIL